MIREITDLSNSFYSEAIQIRRELHMNPELSFQEFITSDFLLGKLAEYGIPFKEGYVKTGIVARIEGRNPGKRTIAIRADMDALPIEEINQFPFKSKNTGVMHACGHDVHMTCVLGAANILKQINDKFEGTVLILFQPGEELLPGGARLMMEEGALNNPSPDAVLALHVQPDIKAGYVGFKPGKYMASNDEIYITVEGKGGHAAMPHTIVDPVLIASHIIVSLQQIVSRNTDISIPTVLSFGKIIGEGATNVIPDQVKLEGTFRTTDEQWREEVHKRIQSIAMATAKGMGGNCNVEIRNGYPPLVNNPDLTNNFISLAEAYLGKDQVNELGIRMTSEDFAFYSQKYPSCLFRLGVGSQLNEHATYLHTPGFVAEESSLKTGIGLLTWLSYSFLSADS